MHSCPMVVQEERGQRDAAMRRAFPAVAARRTGGGGAAMTWAPAHGRLAATADETRRGGCSSPIGGRTRTGEWWTGMIERVMTRYRRFAEQEARGHSPLYEAIAAGIAG